MLPKFKMMPNQAISEKSKDYDWASDSFESLIAKASYEVFANRTFNGGIGDELTHNEFYRKLYQYYLYHGSDTFFANEFSYLTDMVFNEKSIDETTGKEIINRRTYNIPVPIRNQNYIKPVIRQLYGEQLERPFSYSVQTVNKDAVDMYNSLRSDMYWEKFSLQFMQGLQEKGITFKNQEELQQRIKESPANIEEWLKLNYKDKYAQAMNNVLKHEYHYNDIKRLTDDGFIDLLVHNEEIHLLNFHNDNIKLRRINPFNIIYDQSQIDNLNNEIRWFLTWDLMTIEEIAGLSVLTDEQLYTLQERGIRCDNSLRLDNYLYNSYTSNIQDDRYLVYYGQWKSYVGINAVKDKLSEKYYIESTDDYNRKLYEKHKKGETPKTLWMEQAWEGMRIGGELYTALNPIKYQPRSIDNPKKTKLSIAVSKMDGRSLVDDLKNSDFLLKILWHKVEYLLSQAKGKISTYDLAFIPRNFGYDLDKVMYHLNVNGIMLYNSREDGVPNNGGNMIQQIDMSISNTLAQVFQFIAALEQRIEDISGANRQRMAEIKASDGLGNTQTALQQSHARTEYVYRFHHFHVKHLLTLICDFAKEVYKDGLNSSIRKLGTMATEYIKVLPNTLNMADYGIFVNDTTKEARVFEAIRGLAQMFIQQQMLDVATYINILESENLDIAKQKLQAKQEEKMQQAQQAQQQEQQQEQQLLQMKNQHEEKLESMSNQTTLEQARIRENSELTKETQRVELQTQQVQLERERLAAENKKLEFEMTSKLKELEIEANNTDKEGRNKLEQDEANNKYKLLTEEYKGRVALMIEQLKQTADVDAIQLEIQKLEAEKSIEILRLDKEIELKTIEVTSQNNNNAFKEREMFMKQELQMLTNKLEELSNDRLTQQKTLDLISEQMKSSLKEKETMMNHQTKEESKNTDMQQKEHDAIVDLQTQQSELEINKQQSELDKETSKSENKQAEKDIEIQQKQLEMDKKRELFKDEQAEKKAKKEEDKNNKK